MFRFLLDPGQEFGIMQIVTLITFFSIFVGVIIWALFAKKQYVNHMSKLPLEDQNSIKGEN
ncbi:MAG: CcoQ/FixQ family Cbb3-type cytochrome c oxidase assembly chaperone [Planctomycetia bacterium]|nr:CcoQ/FixQ family Cbb3-type cytochrome c oxidase assembly chaperone [Planctomycetia bacterium]NHZ85967.1 CcoQ/FixQ family Cbb3-type cytochrome c oxidase assembly chaperone [Planctomycetia bacterium]